MVADRHTPERTFSFIDIIKHPYQCYKQWQQDREDRKWDEMIAAPESLADIDIIRQPFRDSSFNNYPKEGDEHLISTNHLSKEGSRSNWVSRASIACLVSLIPV
jgi:hypothetical protein